MTDYGLLLARELAATPSTRSAADLAERTRLELPTVQKILKRLSHMGIVKSQRGVLGGYRLAKPADAISVAQIVQALEGPIGLTACAAGEECEREAFCGLPEHWRKISGAIIAALETLTLADLARPASDLRVASPNVLVLRKGNL